MLDAHWAVRWRRKDKRARFVVTIKSWRVLCDDKRCGVQRATLKEAPDNAGMGAGRWKARFSAPSWTWMVHAWLDLVVALIE